jgi:hypothetical protein
VPDAAEVEDDTTAAVSRTDARIEATKTRRLGRLMAIRLSFRLLTNFARE